jgi:hypothetical protein
MKVAVIICGQMRTAEHCAPTIRAAYPDVPFVVHAPLDENAEKAFLFRPAVTLIEPQPELPERAQYTLQVGRGCNGVQRNLRQLWGNQRAWQAFEASGIEADVVVRCRPDLLFYAPPEPPELDEFLHVPTYANWWGLNDRFAWGSVAVMRRYFNRLDRLNEYIDQGGIFHAETFLGWAMRDVPLKRSRMVAASLRGDGTRDEPVWFEEVGDVPP